MEQKDDKFNPLKKSDRIMWNIVIENKRAQRALGRSPEEKVKGQSGAIYRGPLMLPT